MRERIAWALSAVLGLLVVAAVTGVIEGGDVDPDGPPGSTMRPLDRLQPAWSDALPADDGAPGPDPPAGCNSSRFACVLNNEAVLDRETGLVWQRVVSSTPSFWLPHGCGFIGGRAGWRLPTFEEFESLLEEQAAKPWLPSGHPFTGVEPEGKHWTGTTWEVDPRYAYWHGLDATFGTSLTNDVQHLRWCVRSSSGIEG